MSDDPTPASGSADFGTAEPEFRVFHQAMHEPLSSYASKFMQQTGAGDDIAQETLTALWLKWGTIPPEHRRAWVYRVAHNKAVDVLNKQAAERKAASQLPKPAPLHDQDAAMDLALVQDTIEAFSPRKRAILLLARAGLEAHEIAEVLGIKPASVSAELSRLRRKLRTVIGRDRRKAETESSTNNAAFGGGSPA